MSFEIDAHLDILQPWGYFLKIISKLDTALSKKSQTFIKNVIVALLVEPLVFWGFPSLAIKKERCYWL